MCLGIPMEVEAVGEFEAVCAAKGVKRTVSLLLLAHETLSVGDHVLVHVGHAIQKITEDEAAETWRLLDEVLAIEAHEELTGTTAPAPEVGTSLRWEPPPELRGPGDA